MFIIYKQEQHVKGELNSNKSSPYVKRCRVVIKRIKAQAADLLPAPRMSFSGISPEFCTVIEYSRRFCAFSKNPPVFYFFFY